MSARRWFRVQSIGTVRRDSNSVPVENEFYDPWQETILEIDERWSDALTGIDDFSHLVVVFYLDRAKRARKPPAPHPAEGTPDARPVGLFATRTPRRPNPIGLSYPRLIRREGNRLIVTGIDAWPGTPILDIKGYYTRDEQRFDATVPDWLRALWERHDQERS